MELSCTGTDEKPKSEDMDLEVSTNGTTLDTDMEKSESVVEVEIKCEEPEVENIKSETKNESDPLTGPSAESAEIKNEKCGPLQKSDPTVGVGDGDAAKEIKPVSTEDASIIRYLISQSRKNCEVVEAAALDFIAGELHHPVISCFREIRKSDFDMIFNQTGFKTGINELEQGITCITLMDYIATSLGNPLYSEFISKNEYSIRPKVKKIFTELRRVLKDWADNDDVALKQLGKNQLPSTCREKDNSSVKEQMCLSPVFLNSKDEYLQVLLKANPNICCNRDPATFGSGKGMIIKFLDGLTPYFKSIQYDKKFAAALIVLEKDATRAQRKRKLTSGKSLERSALNELVENTHKESDTGKLNGSAEEDGDCELKEDFFDFLDDVPRKSKPAPIFMKSLNKKSPYFRTKSSLPQKPITTTSLQQNPNEKEADSKNPAVEQGTKRPASTNICSSTVKKVCLSNSDTSRSENEVTENSSSTSTPNNNSNEKKEAPVKEKVNAFVFLMNRSKEIAKASKLKKQTKSDSPSLKKTPTVHTVK